MRDQSDKKRFSKIRGYRQICVESTDTFTRSYGNYVLKKLRLEEIETLIFGGIRK